MAKPFNSLSIKDIIRLNKESVNNFGGLYITHDNNFHNRNTLEYIIEATIFPIFGEERYPSIYDKIAAIIQTIITAHVFHDGNKRTALAVLCALCSMNDFIFIPNKDDEDFIVRIAFDNLSIDEVSGWLRKRLKQILKFS